MAEAAPHAAPARKASTTAKSSVIYLAEALRIRRDRRFGVRDPDSDAETSNVVYMSRGYGRTAYPFGILPLNSLLRARRWIGKIFRMQLMGISISTSN